MRTPHRTPAARLARQTVDLGWAAPLVMAHRAAHIWPASGHHSARNLDELWRMSSEKLVAAQTSWWQMWLQMSRSAFTLALSAAPWSAWAREWPKLAAAGLAPVHAKAMSNARRLSRSRRS